jgi:hypothetical protein
VVRPTKYRRDRSHNSAADTIPCKQADAGRRNLPCPLRPASALAALGSAKLLEKLVFGVSASDPLTLAAVAGVLTVVALVVSLVPAYRASRLDPIEVLRAD